jgi:phosphoribosyl-ATP pyrophosphohydrolase
MGNNPLEALYAVASQRRISAEEGSYTQYLFEQGLDKILKKVGEECSETIIAAKNGEAEAVVGEVSDLLYHLIVMLVQLGIPLEAINAELDKRARKSGNLKKFHKTDKDS